MKHTIMFIISVLFLCSVTSGAQDLSSFYNITGFSLTPLKSGQYVISLSPSYLSYSSQNKFLETSSSYSSQSESEYPQSYFTVNSSLLWGLTDETTASLFLNYTPKQSLGQETRTGTYKSDLYTRDSNSKYDTERDDFYSAFVIAHRPKSNLELSLAAHYSTSNQPISGTQLINQTNPSSSTNYDISSLRETQNYSITFNIVLLGN